MNEAVPMAGGAGFVGTNPAAHPLQTEDQGWVAHFLVRALKRHSITPYGDGCQVREQSSR